MARRLTSNVNAAISSGANLVRDQGAPYGLDGTGMKVGVWDGGSVRSTHQEFGGRVNKRNASAANDDHATHVAGTIGATGVDSRARGMAPKVSIDSYDWTSDYAEMTAAGAATSSDTAKIPISNHSYGYNAVTSDMGRYETEARTTDALAVSLPYYLIFWAAGNEQGSLTAKGGYQSITFNGLAKNIMTIGAADDAVTNGVRNPSVGILADFSSMGPCDDGRIKPDVTANGVELFSSVATSDTSYDGTYSGTSMATPSAAGSAVLLEQLYAREFSGQRLRASLLKALLIHTADDVGRPGPDYQYGWGYINVKTAADVILASKASLASPKLMESTVTNAAKTKTHTFVWDGTSPIRATLCWTDPAGVAQTAADSRIPNLVHDLDLKITAPNGTTVSLPFVMPFVGKWTTASMTENATTGINKVDTVEQVFIPSPTQAGTYTVSVSTNSTLTTSSQAYSLVVTGGTSAAANPPPTVTLDSPVDGTVVIQGAALTLNATASDTTVAGGPGTVASVEFFNGATSLGVDSSAPYSLSWTPPASGNYSLSASASDSEGSTASSNAAAVLVLSGSGAPGISSFTPSSGAVGSSVVITGTNFAEVTAVRFNGVASTSFAVNSLSQITASVPATATTGAISVVTATRGTASSSSIFTVLQSPVLISQIYGGGGQAGATYNADYIELYNRSGSPVSLNGWSVQYASASGTSWQVTNLSGTIAAGKYFLIKQAGGNSGSALPGADATGLINFSTTNGKIALLNSATTVAGSSPLGLSALQDFVGYGAANAFEGTAAAPLPSTTAAIFRAGAGATDSGSNGADFATGTPNPRNSAGVATAPVITSASVAGGVVGQAFSYSITASNGPTSYGAIGLPAGLTANATTGLISGTPTTAGTSNATISAANTAGAGNATLTITIAPAGGGGTQVLSENFASLASGNSTSTTGSSTAWTGNVNFPTASTAYQSGGSVKLGTNSSAGSITSRALDLSANGGSFSIGFDVKGWTSVEGNLTVTVTGQSPRIVSYSSVMSGSFEAKTLNFTGGMANSTVTIATTSLRAFIDNVVVSTSSATPTISTNGTLAAVTTTYGTASVTPARFTVSGANMTAGILVTPPAGFEVSQTAGGVSGYAATQTIGGSGTIGAVTVFVRLAAATGVGSYSGNVVCTSPGAVPVNVATTPSDIRQKVLTITANDRSKPFGSILTLGAGQTGFMSSGLVGSETIGSVTLSSDGGLSANDALGSYVLTPSSSTGGTFNVSNYDVLYQTGTLTVTGQDFNTWIGGNFTGDAALPGADPDGDGLTNLVEYFLALSPSSGDASGAISVDVTGDTMTMFYRKSKSLSGVTGRATWSTTLAAPWSQSGVTDELVSDQGTYEVRRASVTIGSGNSRMFMRLEITTP